MPASTAWSEDMLRWALNIGGPFQSPETVYIGWHTADPGLTGANEAPNTTFPERTLIVGGFSIDYDTANSDPFFKNNTAGITADGTASTVTITHFGIWTSAVIGAGEFLYGGQLSTSTMPAILGEKLKWPAGGITGQLGPIVEPI